MKQATVKIQPAEAKSDNSKMRLLVDSFEDELARLAETATEIKILIAFLTEGGLEWLPKEIIPRAQLIVGTDLNITSPGALKHLQNHGADVKIFSEPGRMFHPKAIYLRTADTEFLIVGSNNLTSGGIGSNHEISILTDRNERSENAFRDFLGHFNVLWGHPCSRIPDDNFYKTYRQSDIQRRLLAQLNAQEPMPLQPADWPKQSIADADVSTIGEYIRLLAREFPNLERKQGGTVTGHPLKLLNDTKFRPLFEHIIDSASQGRLTGWADLNQGGNWRIIPIILATDEDREPWKNTYQRGRLVLQFHFSQDFAQVYLSLALQYNLHKSVRDGQMSPLVSQRFHKILQRFGNYLADTETDRPAFLQWRYDDDKWLWVKPIITFSYSLDSLPDDRILLDHLVRLTTVLDGAMAIS